MIGERAPEPTSPCTAVSGRKRLESVLGQIHRGWSSCELVVARFECLKDRFGRSLCRHSGSSPDLAA